MHHGSPRISTQTPSVPKASSVLTAISMRQHNSGCQLSVVWIRLCCLPLVSFFPLCTSTNIVTLWQTIPCTRPSQLSIDHSLLGGLTLTATIVITLDMRDSLAVVQSQASMRLRPFICQRSSWSLGTYDFIIIMAAFKGKAFQTVTLGCLCDYGIRPVSARYLYHLLAAAVLAIPDSYATTIPPPSTLPRKSCEKTKSRMK